ncbi:hypothetical protein ACFL5C_03035, partial [Candidatus Omnitrophota bacterium]
MRKKDKRDLLKIACYEYALVEAYKLVQAKSQMGNIREDYVRERVLSVLRWHEAYDEESKQRKDTLGLEGTLKEPADIIGLLVTSPKLSAKRSDIYLAMIEYLREEQTRGLLSNIYLGGSISGDLRSGNVGLKLINFYMKLWDPVKDARVNQKRQNIDAQREAYSAATVKTLKGFLAYWDEAYQLTRSIKDLQTGTVDRLETELARAKKSDAAGIESDLEFVRGRIYDAQARLKEIEGEMRSLLGVKVNEEFPIDLASKPFLEEGRGINRLFDMYARYGVRLGIPEEVRLAESGVRWAEAVRKLSDVKGIREVGIGLGAGFLNLRDPQYGLNLLGFTGSINVTWGRTISEAHTEFLTALTARNAEAARTDAAVKKPTLERLAERSRKLRDAMNNYIRYLETLKEEYETEDSGKRWLKNRHDYFQVMRDIPSAKDARDQIERELSTILRDAGIDYRDYAETPENVGRMDSDSIRRRILERAQSEGSMAKLSLMAKEALQENHKFTRWYRRLPIGLSGELNLGGDLKPHGTTGDYGWLANNSERQGGPVLGFFGSVGIKLDPMSAFGLWGKFWKLSYDEAVKRLELEHYRLTLDALRMVNNYRARKVEIEKANEQLVGARLVWEKTEKDENTTWQRKKARREYLEAERAVLNGELYLEGLRGQISSALGADFLDTIEQNPMTIEEVEAQLRKTLTVLSEGYDPVEAEGQILKISTERALTLLRLTRFKGIRTKIGAAVSFYSKTLPRTTSAKDPFTQEEIINPRTGNPFIVPTEDGETYTERRTDLEAFIDFEDLFRRIAERGMEISKAKGALKRSRFILQTRPRRAKEAYRRAAENLQDATEALTDAESDLEKQKKKLEALQRSFDENSPEVSSYRIREQQKEVKEAESRQIRFQEGKTDAYIQFIKVAGPDQISPQPTEAKTPAGPENITAEYIRRQKKLTEMTKGHLEDAERYFKGGRFSTSRRAVNKAEILAAKIDNERFRAEVRQRAEQMYFNIDFALEQYMGDAQARKTRRAKFLESFANFVKINFRLDKKYPGLDREKEDLKKARDENQGWLDYERSKQVIDPNTGMPVSVGRPEVISRLEEEGADLATKQREVDRQESRQVLGMNATMGIEFNLNLWAELCKARKQAQLVNADEEQLKHFFAISAANNYREARRLEAAIKSEEEHIKQLKELKKRQVFKRDLPPDTRDLDMEIAHIEREINTAEGRIDQLKNRLRQIKMEAVAGWKYFSSE